MSSDTLLAVEVVLAELPQALTERSPRYPTIPAARLERRAVDKRLRGLGLCGALLFDAVLKAVRSKIAMHAIIVEATGNLRAMQLLLGHTEVDGTVRYRGFELEVALEFSERVEI